MPIRLFHLADLHLGYTSSIIKSDADGINLRLRDFLNTLDTIVERAIQSADVVVIAGDVFHNLNPSATLQTKFAEKVHKLVQNDIPLVLIPGNHDSPISLTRVPAMDLYRVLEIEGVTVFRQPGILRVETRNGTLQVLGIPYSSYKRLLSKEDYRTTNFEAVVKAYETTLSKVIMDEIKKLDPTLPTVLMAHVSVTGAVVGSEQDVTLFNEPIFPKSVLIDDKLDYIALGHIHRYQVIYDDPKEAIIYSGSVERINFGEEGQPKGYVEALIEKGNVSWEFVELPVRSFVTCDVSLKEDDPTPKKTIREALKKSEIQDSILRIRINCTSEHKKIIEEQELRRLTKNAFHLHQLSIETRDQRPRSRLPGVTEETSPKKAIESFLQDREQDKERKKRLTDLSLDYLSKWEESQR